MTILIAVIYSPDIIYRLVGRDDKVATVYLHKDSSSAQKYGNRLVLLVEYDQYERTEREGRFESGLVDNTHGVIKARLLGTAMRTNAALTLAKEGIRTEDIAAIASFSQPPSNLYHSEDKRTLNALNIRFAALPNGGDYEWIYGFLKMKLSKEIGLSPDDYDLYLALKLTFEPDAITPEEDLIIRDSSGAMKRSIEFKLVEIKGEIQGKLPTDEEERYAVIFKDSLDKKHAILKTILKASGVKNEDLLPKLLKIFPLILFEPITVNAIGKRAIYLDFEGYVHVCLRHLDEFNVVPVFAEKDKFLWDLKDIPTVIRGVIQSVDAEIQLFWETKPNARFSKYGSKALYYEGDYYTFHIEPDGRISTFHRNKKK